MKVWTEKIYPGIISLVLIIFLPFFGIVAAEGDPGRYLHFPPRPVRVSHAPFSSEVFSVLCFVIIFFLIHPFVHVMRKRNAVKIIKTRIHSFPLWGWASFFLMIVFWAAAWTRFPVLDAVQRFTFTPLWISYIFLANALCFRRSGGCLLTERPVFFFTLFPASALFWWIFEYLNRFTANWNYSGQENLGALQYTAEATLAFSTVLPAVMSTAALLRTFPGIFSGLDSYIKLKFRNPYYTALIALVLSGTGLALIGVFPDQLFPLLWISPLCILVCVRYLVSGKTFFTSLSEGDWRPAAVYSISALVCGFFWEMWNMYSLARWTYSIPYADCCRIFEMPLPGYAG